MQELNREIQALSAAALDKCSGTQAATPERLENGRILAIRAKTQQMFTTARERRQQCMQHLKRLQAQSSRLLAQTRAMRNPLQQRNEHIE
jgi:hypothetical protein